MEGKNLIIAIDGYSSCGKSTLAKALAKKLGFIYVDSGAMYRAVTLYFLREQIDCLDNRQVEKALQNINIDMQYLDGQVIVLLNGEDVSAEIRQMHVSEKVSEVSALKKVRVAMVAQQQEIGKRRNLVMDGRDIGTHVFPNADLKIFMTADPHIRAKRRYQELLTKGEQVSLEEVIENLQHRDLIDTTRRESPLVKAADAVLLDNTNLDEGEQLNLALQLVSKKMRINEG